MAKWVYLFSEGNASMRELLGGKGANLNRARCIPGKHRGIEWSASFFEWIVYERTVSVCASVIPPFRYCSGLHPQYSRKFLQK